MDLCPFVSWFPCVLKRDDDAFPSGLEWKQGGGRTLLPSYLGKCEQTLKCDLEIVKMISRGLLLS